MAGVTGTDPVYSAKPYLHLYFSDIATLQLSITTFLLLCAAVNVNRETNLSEVNNHRRTIWAVENYKETEYFQINADGIKYYNYTDPMTGETTNAAPARIWFDEILKGKFVYMFGTSFNTFCWPRIAPLTEWFRSIYRSTQLTPWVQVPLKAAVLLGMALRIVNSLIFSAVKNFKDPKPKFGKYFASIVVYNEIFHNVSLFLLSNYLKDPDSQYFYLFRPVFITAYISFIIKMFSSFWHTGFHTLTYIRIVQGFVMAITFIPNYTNILAYLDHNYCDNYTTPMVGIYEWAALICLWGAEVLDTLQCSNYDIISVKNYCEEEQEMEINGISL